MIAGQLYAGEKFRFLKSEVLSYPTSGFPFTRGFPSHEWNDIRLLTMIAGQLYEGEKFRFLKNEC